MAFISYAAVRLAQNRRSSAGFPPRRLLLRTYLDQRADARRRAEYKAKVAAHRLRQQLLQAGVTPHQVNH